MKKQKKFFKNMKDLGNRRNQPAKVLSGGEKDVY